MGFYVLKNQTNGLYLSMRGDGWVVDLREAAVFSLRSTAVSSIRRAWGAVVWWSASNACQTGLLGPALRNK